MVAKRRDCLTFQLHSKQSLTHKITLQKEKRLLVATQCIYIYSVLEAVKADCAPNGTDSGLKEKKPNHKTTRPKI